MKCYSGIEQIIYNLIKNKIQVTPRIANTNSVDALIKTIETSNINANTKPKLKILQPYFLLDFSLIIGQFHPKFNRSV